MIEESTDNHWMCPLSVAFAVVACLLPVAIYFLLIRWVGFFDGHKTEYERALLWLYYPFVGVSLLFAGGIVAVGWSQSKRLFVLFVVLYLLMVLGVYLGDAYLFKTLNHGGGG